MAPLKNMMLPKTLDPQWWFQFPFFLYLYGGEISSLNHIQSTYFDFAIAPYAKAGDLAEALGGTARKHIVVVLCDGMGVSCLFQDSTWGLLVLEFSYPRSLQVRGVAIRGTDI